MALLEVKNIYKSFGGVKAIQNFSIEANAGEIHGIIGPNGAGKTTIFNTISGVYTADQGTVLLDGKDITKLEQYKITRLGMGRTFQNIRLFKGLTVEENVMCAFDPQSRYSIVGGLLPTPKRRAEEKRGRELCEKYLTVVGMQDYLHERPENLSYGMPHRDCPRPDVRAENPAAGRACRRFEPHRGRRVDRADPAHQQGDRLRHFADRASSGAGNEHFRQNSRAELRRNDRRGYPR